MVCQFRERGWDVSHLIWPEVRMPLLLLLLPLDPSCFFSTLVHSFEILLRSKSVPSALMFICGSSAGELRRVPRPATLLGNLSFPPYPPSVDVDRGNLASPAFGPTVFPFAVSSSVA